MHHNEMLYLLIFWVASNVISTMPSTEDVKALGMSPGFVLIYRWLHDLLHVAAGNVARVIPQLRVLQQQQTGGNNGLVSKSRTDNSEDTGSGDGVRSTSAGSSSQ